MQVTSLLSQKDGGKPNHDHDHDHEEDCPSCGHEHEHTPVKLHQTLVGLLFITASFIVTYFFENGKIVGDVNAMIGRSFWAIPSFSPRSRISEKGD